MTDALGYFVVTHPEPVGDLTDWPAGWPPPGTVGDFAERCEGPCDPFASGAWSDDTDDEEGDVDELRRQLRALYDPVTGDLRPLGACGCDVDEPLRTVAPLPDGWWPAVEDAGDEATFADPDDVEQDA